MLRQNCAVLFYNNIVGRSEGITAERERYDRRPKRRHNREKIADAPILAMTARKPPNGGKSRADAKSALSVRKHGIVWVQKLKTTQYKLVRGTPLRPRI